MQRAELAARVLDLMPFEHFTTQWQPSMIEAILALDDQLQNHLVDPDQVIAFNEERLDQLSAHRSDQAYRASLERIELARAAKVFREEKRRLGGLLRHGVVVAIVHAAVAWPFLSPVGAFLVLGIAAFHMAIDRAKAMAARPRRLRAFTLDQAAHAVVLAGAWLAWTRVPG